MPRYPTLRIPASDAVTRIAAVLWQSEPGADFLAEVERQNIRTTDELAGVVRKMLRDPRAKAGVVAFYRWWLDLPKLVSISKAASVTPSFDNVKGDMEAETEAFAVDVTLGASSTFETLLTAPYSFLNDHLAGHIYGVAGVVGAELRRVELDPTQRAGLLTQPALQALASHPASNEPSRRGMHVLQQFFCAAVPAEPPGTPAFVPSQPGVTMRQALEQSATSNASCAACHALVDPPGLAFESLDAIGRWRTTDNGAPVDTSGLALPQYLEPPGTFDGPVALASAIARAPKAQRCMTRQWLAFALDEATADVPDAVVDDVHPAFAASGFDLQALITAVLTSDAFLAP